MGIGEFSVDMGNGFFQNPRTGEIVDSFNGAVFSNEAELQTMASQPPSMSGQYAAPGAGVGADAAMGGLGTAGLGYLGYDALAPATAATISAAPAGAAATGVGTSSAGAAGGVAAPGAGMFLPAAGIAAGAGTGYLQAKGVSNILKDKKPSWLESAAMFPITGGLDILARPFLGGGKHKDQRMRDQYRGGVRENAPGFYDGDGSWNVSLSSGANLDWGKDGKNRLQNTGTNIDGRTERRYHDVDFSRGDSADLVAFLDPLGAIMGKGSNKGTSDMTGYLTNTAQSSGDSVANALELYQRAGLDYGSARDMVNQLDTDQGRKDAYFNSLDRLFGQNAYSGKKPSVTQQPRPQVAAVPAKPTLVNNTQQQSGATIPAQVRKPVSYGKAQRVWR